MSGFLLTAARRAAAARAGAHARTALMHTARPVRGVVASPCYGKGTAATPMGVYSRMASWHAAPAMRMIHTTSWCSGKRPAAVSEAIEPVEEDEFDSRFEPASGAEDVDGLMEEVLRRYSPEKHDAADFDRIVDEVAMEFLQSSRGQVVGSELEAEWDAFQREEDGPTAAMAGAGASDEFAFGDGEGEDSEGGVVGDAGELDEPDEAMLHEDEVLDAFRSLGEDELAKVVADVVAKYTPTGNEAEDDAAVSALVDRAIDARVMELLVRREEQAEVSAVTAEEAEAEEARRLGHKESRTQGRNARAGKKKRKKLAAQREEAKRDELEAAAQAAAHRHERAARMAADDEHNPFDTDSDVEEVDVSAWDAADDMGDVEGGGDSVTTDAYAEALREQMAMLQAELEAVEAKQGAGGKGAAERAKAGSGDEQRAHDSFAVDVDAEGRVVVQDRRTRAPVPQALWEPSDDAWAMGEGDGRAAPRGPRKSAVKKAQEAARAQPSRPSDTESSGDETDDDGDDSVTDEMDEYGAVLRSARGSGAGGAAARGRGRGTVRERDGVRVVPLKQAARVEQRLQRILTHSMHSAELAYENVSVQEVEMSNDLRRAVVWWTLHAEALEDEPDVARELFERDLVRKRRVIRKKLADSMRSSRVVPILTFRYDDRAAGFDEIEREMMELGIPLDAADDPNPTSAE